MFCSKCHESQSKEKFTTRNLVSAQCGIIALSCYFRILVRLQIIELLSQRQRIVKYGLLSIKLDDLAKMLALIFIFCRPAEWGLLQFDD